MSYLNMRVLRGTVGKFPLILLAIILILVFAFFFVRQPKSSIEEGRNSLNVAVFQLYISGMVVAADQSAAIDANMHCFADAGVDPTLIKRSKGPEIVDALVGGSADIGTLALTPQVLQALQGERLVTIATIQTTDKDIKVVAHRSSGIRSGADLKGKRVGFVGGTIGEIFLERYLQKYGVSLDEISGTSAGPAQLRDLFLNGSVDAIIIWEPVVQDILRDDTVDQADVFIDVDQSLYNLRMNIVARPEALEQKREAIEAFVRAMRCGEQLLTQHPEAAQEQIELWLEREPGTLESVFDEATFRLSLDVPKLLKEMAEEAAWAQRAVFHGEGKVPADFASFVDTSVMKGVAPDRMQFLLEDGE